MNQFTDRQIIQLCLDKDPQGWEVFLNRFSNLIWWAIKYKLVRCGYRYTEEDLKDIFQEILSSLWERKKFEKIKHTEKISSWLVVVSSNITVDYLRSKRYEQDESDCAIENIINSSDTKNILYTNELNNILEEILNSFLPKEKEALVLNYLYDKKHREIAQILKLSQNTVSTIIARAKEKLKTKLISKGIRDI